MASPSYWEKTVEYAFVFEALNSKKFSFVAPLSGKEERAAGDAIFGAEDKLILVEFKVGHDELASEEGIFIDYPAAKQQMLGKDGHHFLVYAGNTPTVAQPLPSLCAQTYFGAKPLAQVTDCYGAGVDHATFKNYVTELFALKHADGRSTSGQISPTSLANVVGINPASGQVSTVTLYQYAEELIPDLVLENQLDQSIQNNPWKKRSSI